MAVVCSLNVAQLTGGAIEILTDNVIMNELVNCLVLDNQMNSYIF